MGIGVLDIPLSYIGRKLDHVIQRSWPFPRGLHPIIIALTVASGSGNISGRNTDTDTDTDTDTVPYGYQLTKFVKFSHHSFSIG